MARSVAKQAHLDARRLLLDHLDIHPGKTVDADLDPAEVGIVGSASHVATGTSYHLGRGDLDLSKRPYSVYESPRDQRGLDEHASAMDVGWFRVTTARGTFDLRAFSRWLVGLCQSGDPDTVDVREVIYSLDGKTVRRWDDLGIRSTGDSSHLTHTHISEYRDATGARMVRLAQRWLGHIGLMEEDVQLTDKLPNGSTVGGALVTIMNRTDYLANKLGLAQRLDQILAAAVDDGNTTVTMTAEDRQSLARDLAAAIAVPNVEDIGRVLDRELDEQSRAGADAD
jgi:hypothetical protein